MRKRILFVDDEVMILDGLQRMLRPMREEWELEFATSGASALARMAEVAFDVVVSDMRMPEMSGAEFLSRVMRLYPKTVRLILSGHADQDLILRCVGSTHQFLSKPCDPEVIKDTVRRAAATEDALLSDTLKTLVGRMSHLPSIPSLYTEIVEALQDPEISLQTIGRIVARDIAMTAQLLKLVNSAFFGLRFRVSSPDEAVNYLGLETLRALVLSLHAFSQFQHVQGDGFSCSALWTHSLEAGMVARAVAQSEDAGRKLADEAFVAGLLHDTGKLVLAANFPGQYADVEEWIRLEGVDACAAEQRVFGANHADVGGYLLGLWGLPVPVVEAIAFHHRPAAAAGKTFSPLTAVHVANALVHGSDGVAGAGPGLRLDREYLSHLGLTARLSAWQQQAKNLTTTSEAA